MQILKSLQGLWLLIFVFIELGFQTWWHKQWGDHLSPIVLFLAGIGTCWMAFRMVAFKKSPIESIPLTTQNKWKPFTVFKFGS